MAWVVEEDGDVLDYRTALEATQQLPARLRSVYLLRATHRGHGMDGNYLVLARKYRPRSLTDVVGQPHVVQTLRHAVEQDRVYHAYLFAGSRGLGKTSTARILAHMLNCYAGPIAEPCGECIACQRVAEGYPIEGLTEIDGASNNSVDHIRDLRSHIGQEVGARYHVVVIDEVHMLTTAAFNALLKTLEEPPDHVKFVFATTEIQKVPETIVSRCQRLEFRRIPASVITKQLLKVAAAERVRLSPDALGLIARLAEGSMRDALSKLDQTIAFCGATATVGDIERIFGMLSRSSQLDLVRMFLASDHRGALAVGERIHVEGLDATQNLRDLAELFRDLIVLHTCGADAPLVDASPKDRAAMAQLAASYSVNMLLYAVEILLEGLRRARVSGFPRLAVELTFVKLCSLEELPALPDLVQALERATNGDTHDDRAAALHADRQGLHPQPRRHERRHP